MWLDLLRDFTLTKDYSPVFWDGSAFQRNEKLSRLHVVPHLDKLFRPRWASIDEFCGLYDH